MARHPRAPALLLFALAVGGCRSTPAATEAAASAASAAPSVPVDRLAPGELAPSDLALFGLTLPRGMRIDGVFGDMGYASGKLRLEDVAAFVRTRVKATHVELGAGRMTFPRVKIPGAPADRTYRIEVVEDGNGTRLVVREFVPRPPEPQLTEAERWRRAGFHPDGTPLDPSNLR